MRLPSHTDHTAGTVGAPWQHPGSPKHRVDDGIATLDRLASPKDISQPCTLASLSVHLTACFNVGTMTTWNKVSLALAN